MSFLHIHCQNCGEFHHTAAKRLDRCPTCGSVQAIILPHDYEIEHRFRTEKQDAEDYGAAD